LTSKTPLGINFKGKSFVKVLGPRNQFHARAHTSKRKIVSKKRGNDPLCAIAMGWDKNTMQRKKNIENS